MFVLSIRLCYHIKDIKQSWKDAVKDVSFCV